MRIVLIVCIIILAIPYPLNALPAEDVEIINDRDYFPRVHQLLQGAKKSIYVIMFSAHYYDQYPDSPPNILLRDLADAKRRGLDVKVILEQGEPESSGGLFRKTKIQPQQHERVVQFLERNNVPYILDPPDIITHAKLIIIDETYTIIGSTNWSYSAISKNHETAVVIKSQDVAHAYITYIKNYI